MMLSSIIGVYGAFLLACYDADNEEYQSICKIGKLLGSFEWSELYCQFNILYLLEKQNIRTLFYYYYYYFFGFSLKYHCTCLIFTMLFDRNWVFRSSA